MVHAYRYECYGAECADILMVKEPSHHHYYLVDYLQHCQYDEENGSRLNDVVRIAIHKVAAVCLSPGPYCSQYDSSS